MLVLLGDGGAGHFVVPLARYRGGHIALVDFWTYSRINCRRTIPYVKAWYERYEDQGLVVVGVHTLRLHIRAPGVRAFTFTFG